MKFQMNAYALPMYSFADTIASTYFSVLFYLPDKEPT